MDNFLEYLSTMFVVAELVEAGASGSEQHDIPKFGSPERMFDSGFKGFGMIDLR